MVTVDTCTLRCLDTTDMALLPFLDPVVKYPRYGSGVSTYSAFNTFTALNKVYG